MSTRAPTAGPGTRDLPPAPPGWMDLPPAPPIEFTAPPPAPPTPPSRRRGRGLPALVAALVVAIAVVAFVVIRVMPGASVAAPTGLKIVQRGPDFVVIAWRAVPEADSYVVVRDGARVGTVSAPAVRYRDEGLTPATTHEYVVRASDEGAVSADSSPLSADTTAGTKANAAVAGEWTVRLRLTEEYGYTQMESGDTKTVQWTIASDARGVHLMANPFQGGLIDIRLKHEGARWTGTAKAELSMCVTTPVTTTFTVRLTPSRTGMAGGEWSALELEGTLTDVAPGSSVGMWRCEGSGYTASVAATRTT